MQNLNTNLFKLMISSIICLCIGCTKSGGDGGDNGSGGGDINSCGDIGLRTKIINGTTCQEGSSPLVSLAIQAGEDVNLCTGSLVTANKVLTAAHCFQTDAINGITVTGGPVGAGSQRTTVDEIIPHPGFNIAPDGTLKNDIAILTLTKALSLPTFPIFASRQIKSGEELSIYGFGKDEKDETGLLKSGRMTVSDISQDNIFAIYTSDSSNTCTGDSGGPAIFTAERDDGARVTGLIGVTSTGSGDNCNLGERSSFTNLVNPEVLDFIRENVPGVSIQ